MLNEQTKRLNLPYIMPSQAQKHITHNESLQRLDAVVQLVVKDVVATPPGDPVAGDCFAITEQAAEAWTQQAGNLAFYQDGDWIFLTPQAGWHGWFLRDQSLRVHDGKTWASFDPLKDITSLGINAQADDYNRLTVRSEASLFNNLGAGHQIKVNKNGAGDTASLLFQTGWSGRAEMGVTAGDRFEIKVSADGSAWASALTVMPNGAVLSPNRPVARVRPASDLLTSASVQQTGFDDPLFAQGGFALGAVVVNGKGKQLLVPTSGPYLISLSVEATASSAFTVGVMINGTSRIVGRKGSGTALTVAYLNEGDRISLDHTGTAKVDFSDSRTELTLVLL